MRTIVITGASAGIGLAVAVRLADGGDRVIAGVRHAGRAAAVAAAARAAGVAVEPIEMDVCSDMSVSAAINAIQERYGAIDALVCNAGAGAIGTLEELSMEAIRAAMEVNFYGV